MTTDDDLAAGIVRLVRAMGARCADADPDSHVYLKMIEDELRDARDTAVRGWQHNWTDTGIARELGVSKQAVSQRWPRKQRHG